MRDAKAPKGPGAKYLFVMAALLLLLVGVVYPAAAQEPTPIPAVLLETDEGIVFYGLDNANELEEVGRLPPEFVISGSQQDDQWALRTEFGENNVTLSPDHQSLAFTARSFGPPVWVKLFIYDLKDKQLSEGFSGVFDTFPDFFSLYDFALNWSPDNQKILANPHPRCCEGPFDPMPEMYVYDLPNGAWWAVTNTPNKLEWEPAWSSDSESIAYRFSWGGDFFYLVDWQGNNRRLFATQDFSIPEISYLNFCNFTWSDVNQRWYYILGRCNSQERDNRAYIASATAEDERIEVSLSDLLLIEISYLEHPYLETVDVKGINVTNQGVYIGFDFMYRNDEKVAKRTYRVIRIDGAEIIKTIFEFVFDDDYSSALSQTAFTPDSSKVALVDSGKIIVGDLTTGQQIAYATRKLESYWVRVAVRWLDNNRLLYCDAVDVWLLDTRDGTNINLTADIEAPAWLIAQTNSN